MEKSPTIKNLAQALLTFHKEVGKIKKSETNPFFKSKYADLSSILSGIQEPLQTAGLVVSQFPVGENELDTILIHTESGEWISGRYKMTPAKNDPQGQGSVITYQRRYALGAILSLNIDEDDDANAGSSKPSKSTPKKTVSNDEAFATAMDYIEKANSIAQLTELEKNVKSSIKLLVDEKTKLLEVINEKILTLDPTA